MEWKCAQLKKLEWELENKGSVLKKSFGFRTGTRFCGITSKIRSEETFAAEYRRNLYTHPQKTHPNAELNVSEVHHRGGQKKN